MLMAYLSKPLTSNETPENPTLPNGFKEPNKRRHKNIKAL
jgi:hypothetical protein